MHEPVLVQYAVSSPEDRNDETKTGPWSQTAAAQVSSEVGQNHAESLSPNYKVLLSNNVQVLEI